MARHLLILTILINCVLEVKGAHAVNETCPPFWIKVVDKDREQIYCYKDSIRTHYLAAVAHCITKNASLHSPKYFPTPVYQKSTWLGLKWEGWIEGEGKWHWTDGSPVELDWSTWNPWAGGIVGDGSWFKHCVYFDINSKKWMPSKCYAYRGFYCDRTQCPKGWTFNPYTHRCVKVFPESLTYTEAARSCSEHQSIVEAFRSPAAYQWFTNTLVPDWTVVERRNIWLGITDQPEPGRWMWHDGAVARWTNFKFTPEYAFKRDANNSCAVAMATDGGKWVPKGCLNHAHTYRYVCAIHRCQFPFKQSVNGKCYARLAGGSNAFESSKRCGIIGGQLLTLEEKYPMWDDVRLPSKSEADFNQNADYGMNLKSAWIGLSDMYQQSVWQWNGREGRSPPISAWLDAGQPIGLDKDCAVVASRGKFVAVNCKDTFVHTVICQRYEPYKVFDCRENVILGMGDYTHDQYSLHPQGVGRTCHVPVYDLKTSYPEAMRFCGRLGGHVMQIKTTTFMEQIQKWGRTQIDVTGNQRSLSVDPKKGNKRVKRAAILPIVRPDEDQTERERTYSRFANFWVGLDTLGTGFQTFGRKNPKAIWNDGSEPETHFKTLHVAIDDIDDKEHCFASDHNILHDQNCFNYNNNFFCEVPLSPVVRQRKQFEWNAACQVPDQKWKVAFPQYTNDGDVNGNTRANSDDWFFDGESCFFTPQRKMPKPNIGTHADQEYAKSFCTDLGATLPLANSIKETRGVQLARRGVNLPWIGLQNIRLGVNRWKWLTARQVADPLQPLDRYKAWRHPNWDNNQPDNDNTEFCVCMTDRDLWSNVPCTAERAIVCQQHQSDTPAYQWSIHPEGLFRHTDGSYNQISDALGGCPEVITIAVMFCLLILVQLEHC